MSKSRMAAMASSPLFLIYCRFDSFRVLRNLSAENSKLSAESGLQRLQLLECMYLSTRHPITVRNSDGQSKFIRAYEHKPYQPVCMNPIFLEHIVRRVSGLGSMGNMVVMLVSGSVVNLG